MNPEFYRNLLLELTLHRLIALPLILLLVYAAAGLGGNADMAYEVAWYVMMGLLVLWGTRLAADSVLGEISGRTWDSQRMSALGPFSMGWGKLFGATVFVWYGAILSIPAYIYEAGRSDELIIVFLSGLMAQAVALFASLLVTRMRPVHLRFQVTASQAMGISAGIVTWSVLSGGSRGYRYGEVEWYGLFTDAYLFVMLTGFAFLIWACFGIYRLMRAELQFRCWPVGWTCFAVFCAVYMIGFPLSVLPLPGVADIDRPGVETLIRLGGAYAMVLGLVWICAYSEPKGFVPLRRWYSALRSGDPRRILESTPAWLPGLLIGFVLGILILAVWFLSDNTRAAVNYLWKHPSLGAFTIATVLFVLRDIGVVHFLTLDARKRRAQMTALVYIVVLYVLLPMLLAAVGLDEVFPVFFPYPLGHPLVIVLPVLAQVGIVAVLLVFRWKRLAGSMAEA